MKPRIVVATIDLPDGRCLELHQHDGHPYIHLHGEQVIGRLTAAAEKELAVTACDPFRPARQPRVLVVGLGLGRVIHAALEALPQKRAVFYLAEPLRELVDWHRRGLAGLDSTLLGDERVRLLTNDAMTVFRELPDSPHAILLHLDSLAATGSDRNSDPTEQTGWLAAAFECLRPGGMLALGAARPLPRLAARLRKAGFDVAETSVHGSSEARKPRPQPVWFARKPGR